MDLTGPELLALEERQLYYFQTDVRPVGEEKSELYPEPRYFYIAFQTMPFTFPKMRRLLEQRMTPGEYGRKIKAPLSRCTALHVSGAPFVSTWGRQMWLDIQDSTYAGDLIARAGALDFRDSDVADDLAFWYQVACEYREDGFPYPATDRGLGGDYRILSSESAAQFAEAAVGVNESVANDVIRMWATVRALSFLMEAETRDALMMHGPYPLADGRAFVMFECNDLRWRLYPEFPIPGQRWELPDRLPTSDLAVGLVLREADVLADRMGTLYVEPWAAENVEAAVILTRGDDEWGLGDLKQVDINEASHIADACDDFQAAAFLQLAEWDTRQRMAAGHFQKLMFALRVLAGAGYQESDLRDFFTWSVDVSKDVWDAQFDRVLTMPETDFRYYQRMGEFLTGASEHIFTPLRAAEGNG